MNWLTHIFRRKEVYGDLAEEMRLHLEERTEQLMSEGMSRKEAEQTARRAFGNATLLEERSREVWQMPWLESLGTDLKLVLRRLGKSPGFAATVLLTLAIGIGAKQPSLACSTACCSNLCRIQTPNNWLPFV